MGIILIIYKYIFIVATIISVCFLCYETLKNGFSWKEFYICAKAFLIFLSLSFVANGWRVHGI